MRGVGAGDVPGAEAAGGDGTGLETLRLERVDEAEQQLVGRLRLVDPLLAVGLEHAVTFVAERTPEARPGGAFDELGERHRGGDGPHTGAVQADVELDQDADLIAGPARCRGDPFDVGGVVDQHGDRCEPGESGELALLRRADHLVGDEHVGETVLDHRGRFPDRRRGDPHSAGIELHPRKPRALVDLRVGAQRRRDGVHATRHLGDVGAHRRQVDDQRRGRQRGDRAADEAARGTADPACLAHRIALVTPVIIAPRRPPISCRSSWAASKYIRSRAMCSPHAERS